MKKIAVVPAYEPDHQMISLLEDLKESGYLILVVNDGSDRCFHSVFESAKKYATVLNHDVNRGKGAALKTAFSYIQKKYHGYCVVTLDCDGQHKVEDAERLCCYLQDHPAELVLGKRLRSDKTPIKSRLGNMITRSVYRIVTGIDVYDTQTGLRAFSFQLMDFMLSVSGDRYEYEMNILLECSKNKIKIKEIEIETIYFDHNSNSHFQAIQDSYRIYKQIFQFSCVSLLSFWLDYILYVIFNFVLKSILLSNIFARCISSFINYHLNKNLVFQRKNKTSFFRYYLLVIVILMLNTFLLEILVNYLLFNRFVAKIIVEFLLFLFSFIAQRLFVFDFEEDRYL